MSVFCLTVEVNTGLRNVCFKQVKEYILYTLKYTTFTNISYCVCEIITKTYLGEVGTKDARSFLLVVNISSKRNCGPNFSTPIL